ncbi:uncharacterized protein LOC105422337 [Pogonomyrmex barbatus]|uniref:Uncharacterized protein LOC105422337 n=1 Tax=Pogonomyrmex barbatus TaxID=144034 RepID=A0A6I9VTI5_9HYME|nr:uncharacterized protein LOC105422337 [Pogonomyrmex barbatus]
MAKMGKTYVIDALFLHWKKKAKLEEENSELVQPVQLKEQTPGLSSAVNYCIKYRCTVRKETVASDIISVSKRTFQYTLLKLMQSVQKKRTNLQLESTGFYTVAAFRFSTEYL